MTLPKVCSQERTSPCVVVIDQMCRSRGAEWHLRGTRPAEPDGQLGLVSLLELAFQTVSFTLGAASCFSSCSERHPGRNEGATPQTTRITNEAQESRDASRARWFS